MSKKNNLKDFLKDLADAIRFKTQTTVMINPQDFSAKIRNLNTTNSEIQVVYVNSKGNDIY